MNTTQPTNSFIIWDRSAILTDRTTVDKTWPFHFVPKPVIRQGFLGSIPVSMTRMLRKPRQRKTQTSIGMASWLVQLFGHGRSNLQQKYNLLALFSICVDFGRRFIRDSFFKSPVTQQSDTTRTTYVRGEREIEKRSYGITLGCMYFQYPIWDSRHGNLKYYIIPAT
jgi:hypothetical protein